MTAKKPLAQTVLDRLIEAAWWLVQWSLNWLVDALARVHPHRVAGRSVRCDRGGPVNREQMVEKVRSEISEWEAFVAADGHMSIGKRSRSEMADERVAARVLDAILPQVSTVEELEALPIGTVVVGRNGWTWTWSHTKHFGGQDLWLGIQGMCDHGDLVEHYSPLTVVWQP